MKNSKTKHIAIPYEYVLNSALEQMRRDWLKACEELPDTAEIVGVVERADENMFLFIVHDQSFPEREPGTVAERIRFKVREPETIHNLARRIFIAGLNAAVGNPEKLGCNEPNVLWAGSDIKKEISGE